MFAVLPDGILGRRKCPIGKSSQRDRSETTGPPFRNISHRCRLGKTLGRPIAIVRDTCPCVRQATQRNHLIGPASLGCECAASPLLTCATMTNGNPDRFTFALGSKLSALAG